MTVGLHPLLEDRPFSGEKPARRRSHGPRRHYSQPGRQPFVVIGPCGLWPVIDTDGAASLSDWLNNILGPGNEFPEPLVILDLSLVPSDVVHIAVAVISRLVFEALRRPPDQQD